MQSPQTLTPQQKELIEQAANIIASDNVELGCCYIQKHAVEKALLEMDKRMHNVSKGLVGRFTAFWFYFLLFKFLFSKTNRTKWEGACKIYFLQFVIAFSKLSIKCLNLKITFRSFSLLQALFERLLARVSEIILKF